MSEDTLTTVMDIDGMTCASCVSRVERKLNAIDGVRAQVSLATESAKVTYPAGLERERLLRAVDAAGYRASLRPGSAPVGRDDLAGHADHHGHADHADHAGHHEHGADHAEHDAHADDHAGNDHSGHAALHHAGGQHADEHDRRAHAGHHAADPHADHHAGVSSPVRVVVGAALALPVVVLAMVPAWQFPGWQWASLVLATPVVLWAGWPFHRATLKNLRHGAVTMDTLVSLGTMAAYLWSLWALLVGGAGRIGMTHGFGFGGEPGDAVYFEVASVVTVLLLLGRYLEDRARRRAGAALHALMALGAHDVELADGRRVPVERLRVDDEFTVRPGETVATDGVVIDGRAAVDQSMLTGESVPVEVAARSEVTGGTIAYGGILRVRATATGAATRLARIAALVENAQLDKGRAQRLADRISAVFVPVVIVLAVLTLGVWLLLGQPVTAGFTAAVAVLIIACPCALGLATPIAILVGSGRGAQLGILMTGPAAIENADRIDAVVLDKTGTLTTGRMRLAAVTVAPGVDETQARLLVASLEAASEHPIGAAIAASVDARQQVAEVVAEPGRGISGTVAGRRVFAGSPAFAAALAPVPPELLAAAEDPAATVVVAGWSDPEPRVTAVFAVTDTLRPEAADAVSRLRETRLQVALVTGDAEPVARAVAAAAGIDDVRARVSPEGKVAAIRALQAAGHRVAMVGDGVNDAGALAAADLGIAMGGGTDAAAHAGDIALTGTDLSGVVTALALSRRVMRVIRGNLFWAFAYNVAALPLAALGLLNPMVAGAAMAFSSLFVVLNSLRLRRAP